MTRSLATRFLQLIEDFPEIPHAGFACEPLGSADGAQREATAVAGIVLHSQRVALADGLDHMLAGGVAYAMRGDFNRSSRPLPLDDFAQRDSCAGGCIELGRVMRFADLEFVPLQFGEILRQAE